MNFRQQLAVALVADVAGAWLVNRAVALAFPLERTNGLARLL